VRVAVLVAVEEGSQAARKRCHTASARLFLTGPIARHSACSCLIPAVASPGRRGRERLGLLAERFLLWRFCSHSRPRSSRCSWKRVRSGRRACRKRSQMRCEIACATGPLAFHSA
jgi:hypothetical protein